MSFANVTPEAVNVVNSTTGMSDATIIVVAICATIVILALIFFIPNFKIKKCKDGVTLKVGTGMEQTALKENTQTVVQDTTQPSHVTTNVSQ